MSANVSPVEVARFAAMRKVRKDDEKAREVAIRRANLRKNGVRSPLTRAELAARVETR
jgi:hypothetical protein